jgi:hypothetical protein
VPSQHPDPGLFGAAREADYVAHRLPGVSGELGETASSPPGPRGRR